MNEAAVTRARRTRRALSGSLEETATAALGWPLAVATLCFTLTVVRLPTTADSYLDLVVGRLIAKHGVPHTDTLTLLGHGRSWVDQQWLAQLSMYGIWKLLGNVGLGVLLALLIGLSYGLLAHLCIALGAPPQRAVLWALLAFLGSVGFTAVRAEMFSYPALVLTLTLLVRDARRREFELSFLWVLAILAVWANLHGAVVLGALLVFVYCVIRATRALVADRFGSSVFYAGCAVGSVACLVATPYGFSEVRYYHGVFSSSVLREYENEWTSPRLSYLPDWMTFAFAVAVVVAVTLAVRRRHRPNGTLLLATLITGALALDAIRYQPWFAIAGAALVAATLAQIRPTPPTLDPRPLRVGAAALALLALVSAVSAGRGNLDRQETALARGVLAVVARWESEHPNARILADENTSDRLLWWYPTTSGHVALDLRLDFYDPAIVRQWFSFDFGPNLLPVGGATYDVYVASSANGALYTKLREANCLTTIYADAYGIAAVRSASGPTCRSAA